MTCASARALLAGLVDYAGLFPPAGLTMAGAVAEYRLWRDAPEAWMLGRFVLPAGRLAELGATAGGALPPAGGAPWRLSALAGPDVPSDAARIREWNAAHSGRAVVDAAEVKASSAAEAAAALDALPAGVEAFVEVPLDAALDAILPVLRERGARAKARTGGLVPPAIPPVAALSRFVAACASAGVSWKATAGLHHPVRSEHPLADDADAPRAVMHGFLNLLAAAALSTEDAGIDLVEAALLEADPSAFRLGDDGLAFRDRLLPTPVLERMRVSAFTAFGSCSFAEPVADLRQLGILA